MAALDDHINKKCLDLVLFPFISTVRLIAKPLIELIMISLISWGLIMQISMLRSPAKQVVEMVNSDNKSFYSQVKVSPRIQCSEYYQIYAGEPTIRQSYVIYLHHITFKQTCFWPENRSIKGKSYHFMPVGGAATHEEILKPRF